MDNILLTDNIVTVQGNDIPLGIIPDPVDTRDWILESIHKDTLGLPKSVDLRRTGGIHKVRDQGTEGTCSAQTVIAMMEFFEWAEDGLIDELSVKMIYNNRANQDGNGMGSRDTMKVAQQIGTVAEFIYPYSMKEPASKIDPEIIKMANALRIANYASVTTILGAKVALVNEGPVYISVPVYNGGTRMWVKPDQETSLHGGHAMAIVGYDDPKGHFIIRNSWSKSWGDMGYCYFPYEDWGRHWSCWSAVNMESPKFKKYIYDSKKNDNRVSFIARLKFWFRYKIKPALKKPTGKIIISFIIGTIALSLFALLKK